MFHDAHVSSAPALKSNVGEWVLDAQGEANFFRCHICGKVQASTSVLQLKFIHSLHSMPRVERLLSARLLSGAWQC